MVVMIKEVIGADRANYLLARGWTLVNVIEVGDYCLYVLEKKS